MDSQGTVNKKEQVVRKIRRFPQGERRYIINAALRGAGDSLFPMVNTVTNMLLIRVPATYLLANLFGPEYMYWSYAVGWTIGCALSLWYYCSGRWKKKGSLAK